MIALAIGLTRAWVRLYTKGLPPERRETRRAEIDSDLWEQGYDGESNGNDPQETGLQVLFRLLAGIPADLTWRLQERGAAKASRDRSIKMNQSLPMRALLIAALMVAAFPLIIGILVSVGANGEMSDSERALFGPAQIIIGGVIICGLILSRRMPAVGIGLVAIGVIAISAMWYWAAMITIPAGLGLIAIAYYQGRRITGAEGAGGSG